MPLEWSGLNSNWALLTEFYWISATHIARVCVSPPGPINPQLHVSKKCNLQVEFRSKCMASLYDLLCAYSFTSTDPLLEEILFNISTGFHSHIFEYIVYKHSSDDESVHSFDSSVSAFYSDDSTFFLNTFISFLYLFFYATTKFFTTIDWHTTVEKQPPGTKRSATASNRARRPHITKKLPDSASSANCPRLSVAV